MVLKSRLPAPDWSADGDEERDAKCRHFPVPTQHDVTPDTDPFFYDMEEAAHICNGTYDNRVCLFRNRCLHIALVNNEGAGVFGGLLTIQRRWVRKNINRVEWPEPNEWRHEVPPLEFFEEDDEEDAEEEE